MNQGPPMAAQGSPMAAQQMANTPTGVMMQTANSPNGVQMMQAVPQIANVEPSPSQGIAIMQPMAAVNGDTGMSMMQPVMTAGAGPVMVIPAGMQMPGMAGMQAVPVTPPPGFMLKCMNDQSTNEKPTKKTEQANLQGAAKDDSPQAGEKKMRLLEDLLPGGVRRRATREELGRKVFVGGLNPTTTTEDLRAYFTEFGVVTDACVITDSSSKASRGFGFVEFEGKIPEGLLDQQHIIDQRRCGVREYGHSTASSP